MTEIHAVLEKIQVVVFVALGIISFLQWRRHRNSTSAWLVATFGTLGVILVAGQVIPEHSDWIGVEMAREALIVLLVLFPYFLWRFTVSILPAVRWFWWLAHILTVAVVLFVLVAPPLPEEGEPRPSWFGLFLTLFLVQWVVLSLRVAWRLWRAGKGQPTVARRRMRTLSLGALGMAIALIIAGTGDPSTEVRATDVVIQILIIASAALFYLGFAPPTIVRNSWRSREESAFKRAERGLMSALSPNAIAEAILPHVAHLTGGEGAALLSPKGEVIGTFGLTEDKTNRLARAVRDRTDHLDGLPVFAVPLDNGCLALLASPLTPFFGREETEMLTSLAVLADLALARSELFARQAATQERLEEAQHIAGLGSWEWTIATDEISWSDEMFHILGLDKDVHEVDLASYMDAIHEDDKERAAEATKRVIEEGANTGFEHRIVRPDGEVRWVVGTSTVYRDDHGKPQRVIGTTQDITERKRADEFRDQFIANAAHELRTPMTTLVGFVEMLTHGRTEISEERTRQIYDAMGRSGERLTVLISNLLDLSRLQQGALNETRGAVNLKQVVDAALETTPAPDGKAVSHSISEDIEVMGDKHRLLQVVSNLLTNAYRYGGQQVEVNLTRNGTTALLTIADDGPGVEKEIVPSLFEPFARGSTSATVGGSGLGLAIVKALVENAGGRVWYEPCQPRGARFCIEMEVAS